MKKQTSKIILYAAGIFLLISGILGIFLPQLELSLFTSVIWAALGAVFLAIGYGTTVRKIVLYGAGILLFAAGIIGLALPQLGISTLNSLIWAGLGVLFMYTSYSVKY
jgi:tetrahydromethanopterin S-methyltransferase subunit C